MSEKDATSTPDEQPRDAEVAVPPAPSGGADAGAPVPAGVPDPDAVQLPPAGGPPVPPATPDATVAQPPASGGLRPTGPEDDAVEGRPAPQGTADHARHGWGSAARAVVGEPGAVADLVPRVVGRAGGAYRPSMTVDVAVVGGARLAVGSLKGAAHHEFGTVRQDGYGIGVVGDDEYAVVALADGVSEAKLSHLAADLACTTSIAAVTRQLEAGTRPSRLDWLAVVAEVREAIRRRSASSFPAEAEHATPEDLDRAIARQVMSTTLEVVVLSTKQRPVEFVRACLAGDGSAYLLDGAGRWHVLAAGKEAADGLVDNAVHALPRDPGPARVLAGDLGGQALMVCTDGVGDPLGDGDNELGEFLGGAWARPVHAVEFLRGLDFVMAGAIDDRTALVVW